MPGVYREKLTVPATKGPLLVQGLSSDVDGVVIAWDDADAAAGVGKPGCRGANRTQDNAGGEWDSQTMRVDSDDLILANVTVNTAATCRRCFSLGCVSQQCNGVVSQVLNDACGFEGGARKQHEHCTALALTSPHLPTIADMTRVATIVSTRELCADGERRPRRAPQRSGLRAARHLLHRAQACLSQGLIHQRLGRLPL